MRFRENVFPLLYKPKKMKKRLRCCNVLGWAYRVVKMANRSGVKPSTWECLGAAQIIAVSGWLRKD